MNNAALLHVDVLAFGALRERLATGAIACPPAATMRDVWEAAGGAAAMGESVRVARNHELCSWDSVVQDGDEIAFMPPVSGG